MNVEPYERLLLPENLYFAWSKAKKLYRMADGYVDYGELAEFELDLKRRLGAIQAQFEGCSFRLGRLRPLPRPKSLEGETPIDRQYYHVSIDDQVAWIAVVNALGPELDKRMPPWSYGNRIYRPAWYEEDEGKRSTLEIGPYRHASGQLYRKFQHSWPLFRRHIALTARAMVRTEPLKRDGLDRSDELAAAAADTEKLPYLLPGSWNHPTRAAGADSGELYQASLDLKQFFPRINTNCVLHGLLSAGSARDPRLERLLSSMLRFRLDKSNCPTEILANVEPRFYSRIRGIPTGLFVSGFLANVAMMSIDTIVSEKIEERRSIAHFRFVDDHTIIAYRFEDLFSWIEWYRELLATSDTGAVLNQDKFDPPELGAWLKYRIRRVALTNETSPTRKTQIEMRRLQAARNATRLDGNNPTRLLTKTLGQVSEIAATNFDVLDDDDLEKQLGLIEWLLLAEIPDREIRADTRAAFAAGRLALLAPMLIREQDGLVELARSLAEESNSIISTDTSAIREVTLEEAEHLVNSQRLNELKREDIQTEERRLRQCFDWLVQAFQQFPGKARLFQRMLEYCRLTGHRGLPEIVKWIGFARSHGLRVWGDYYSGYLLQLLGRNVLHSARVLFSPVALLSEKDAAQAHIEDIGKLEMEKLLLPSGCEAWFHTVARREFGVALLAASENLRCSEEHHGLANPLSNMATRCSDLALQDSSDRWNGQTGRSPGVWAHMTEEFFGGETEPSASWLQFDTIFSTSDRYDDLAVRRYPENFSDVRWTNLLRSKRYLSETESGWLLELMHENSERISAAARSRRQALSRAARSTRSAPSDVMTLVEWTEFVARNCSPFDPRRSEWTALEIVRQILAPAISELRARALGLEVLNPNNVYVPQTWRDRIPADRQRASISWEGWRDFVRGGNAGTVERATRKNSVVDYRYFANPPEGNLRLEWESTLTSIGRTLLGVLRLDHRVPRIWNLRGNERVVRLPLSRWFRDLAISSRTLLLVEGCLSARSAESRAIISHPDLFGWQEGVPPSDSDFEPPLLQDVNELFDSIAEAQSVLEANQLSVLLNQPRQLIPFRLRDFATGEDDDEGDEIVE